MASTHGYGMISSGFSDAEKLLEKYFIEPGKRKKDLERSQAFAASVRELLGEGSGDAESAPPETLATDEQIEGLELGVDFDTPTSTGAPLYEDVEGVEDLLGVSDYLLGAQDDEPSVISAARKPKISKDEIRRRRQALQLLNINDAFFQHGAPQTAGDMLKNLSRILGREGGEDAMAPEDKLAIEAQRQEIQYGEGSAREGYQRRRAGERAEDDVLDYKRKVGMANLRQRQNLEKIDRRNKAAWRRLGQRRTLSLAIRDDVVQLKNKALEGANPDKVLSTLSGLKDKAEAQIEKISKGLDEYDYGPQLEKTMEKQLDDFIERRAQIERAESFISNISLKTEKTRPEDLQPEVRMQKIRAIDAALSKPGISRERKQRLLQYKSKLQGN